MIEQPRPALLVLASTYPRWKGDHEPGFVHELCKRLAVDFDVIVVTSRSPGAASRETMDGVEVERYTYAPRGMETLVYGGGIATHLSRSPWKLALVPGFVVAQYRAALEIMRRRRIDIIHAHWLLPQGLVARRLARRARIPFVVTSHGGDLFGLRGKRLNDLKCKVADSSAAMTVVSTAMRDEAMRVGLKPPRLEVLPMGADMQSRFTPSAETSRNPDELLFVGRLVAKKGLPHLLEAMPDILRRRPLTRFVIAGFGPEEAALKAQAARLGIDAQVRFLGAVVQEGLPALYRSAAVLVAPFVRDASGNQEGLPVVLMEAIACGCPVVAGHVAGVDDLFGAASAELCVDPADTAALAAAVLAVLEHPEEARARALQLRETIVEKLDWSAIARGYGALLASCLTSAIPTTATQHSSNPDPL